MTALIAGESNREISQSLFIAECTVKKHIHTIGAKVGARTRTSIAHTVRQELGLARLSRGPTRAESYFRILVDPRWF